MCITLGNSPSKLEDETHIRDAIVSYIPNVSSETLVLRYDYAGSLILADQIAKKQ